MLVVHLRLIHRNLNGTPLTIWVWLYQRPAHREFRRLGIAYHIARCPVFPGGGLDTGATERIAGAPRVAPPENNSLSVLPYLGCVRTSGHSAMMAVLVMHAVDSDGMTKCYSTGKFCLR